MFETGPDGRFYNAEPVEWVTGRDEVKALEVWTEHEGGICLWAMPVHFSTLHPLTGGTASCWEPGSIALKIEPLEEGEPVRMSWRAEA